MYRIVEWYLSQVWLMNDYRNECNALSRAVVMVEEDGGLNGRKEGGTLPGAAVGNLGLAILFSSCKMSVLY
jgi:hypothetical protein